MSCCYLLNRTRQADIKKMLKGELVHSLEASGFQIPPTWKVQDMKDHLLGKEDIELILLSTPIEVDSFSSGASNSNAALVAETPMPGVSVIGSLISFH